MNDFTKEELNIIFDNLNDINNMSCMDEAYREKFLLPVLIKVNHLISFYCFCEGNTNYSKTDGEPGICEECKKEIRV